MDTPIGQGLRQSPRHLAWASGLAAVFVLGDVLLCLWPEGILPYRLVLLPLTLIALTRIPSCDRPTLGLTMRPLPGWGYWIKATPLIGVFMAFVVGAGLLVMRLKTGVFPAFGRPPAHFLDVLLPSCVNAPIIEETIYRLILCVPAVCLLRPAGAIVLSGVVFAAFHFASGVASPDNFVAGYILCWAYLKSGSLLVPILLHALGNFCILLLQLGAWYLV